VIAAVGDRGSMYRALVKRHGQLPHERLTGSAELRGSGPELVVVVSLDQMVLSPLGNKKQFGQRRRSAASRAADRTRRW
jgi:hypothetical protein